MIALDTLKRAIPSDDAREFDMVWRTSESGTPNLRVSGRTEDVRWYVDLYGGHYYRAVVGADLGEVWRTLPSLIGYMRRQLGLPPIGAD